jgi:hypothetical protein
LATSSPRCNCRTPIASEYVPFFVDHCDGQPMR